MFITTIVIVILAVREYQFWKLRRTHKLTVKVAEAYEQLLDLHSQASQLDSYGEVPEGKTLLRG
jgi:hypothetical protein